MVRGWSPDVTMQEIWAKSPSFMTSFENEKGPISGSSKNQVLIYKQKVLNLSPFILVRHNSVEFQTQMQITNFLVDKHNEVTTV